MAPRPTARLAAALACAFALLAVAAADLPAFDGGLVSALVKANQQLGIDFPIDLNKQCDKIKTLNAQNNADACQFVQAVELGILLSYNNKCEDPSTSTGIQMQPPSKGGAAPAPLTQPRRLPAEWAAGPELDALLAAEGQTYAFLWVCARNMYAFNKCSPQNGGSYSGYLLPEGFQGVGGTDGVYYNQQANPIDTQPRPYMAIMKKGDTLLVVFRGTGSGGEWFTNFAYDRVKGAPFFTAENEVNQTFRGAAFKGETHRGFTAVFKQVWPSIRAAVDSEIVNGNITHVFVTGHSQGGPVATLAAYAIDRYLKRGTDFFKPSDDFTLDLVVFESPLPGNSRFARSMSRINSRNIKFENDIIAQIPCGSLKKDDQAGMPGCNTTVVPTIGANNITSWNDYAPIAGGITFKGQDMPVQQAMWTNTSLVTSLEVAPKILTEVHGCSISCFLGGHAEGFPDDHCIIEPPLFGDHTPCSFP